MPEQTLSSLLNRDYILKYLTADAPWCESHGAGDDFLGVGILYYALVYIFRAKTAVCLGSGGGFVPRLMRQAQRDLGIGAQAKTILVDANRPESGWGSPAWLPEDSLFRREFDDVDIVLTTTRQAAEQCFAPERASIDYLHIDADHSFEGGLEDFLMYRQFLHPGSLVTLHDTRYQGAGIGAVIDYLRTRADCEVIEFPELGTGTALVRIRGAAQAAAPIRPLLHSQVSAIKRADAVELDSAGMGWKYLETEAFASRNVLAAHFVRGCASVIEIGGGRSSIVPFLTGKHESVIVIDPFGRDEEFQIGECRFARLRARFQDVEWSIAQPASYAMVMLGLELQGMSDEDYRRLYGLVAAANVTVIEFPTSWEPSRRQFDLIQANTLTQVRFHAKLDLAENNFGELSNSWPPRTDREIYVLEPLLNA